jgi:sialidase-1
MTRLSLVIGSVAWIAFAFGSGLNALARSWVGEPTGEPRRNPARTEPRPPGIAQSRLAASAAEPRLEKTTLFTAGEAGYKLYRIPGIVVTARGNILAYCEARRSDQGDWGTIDIVMRRSSDGGRHWLAPQHIAHHGPPVPKNPVALEKKLASESARTINNPVAIAERDGTVHFLYCAEYARCFHMQSADDGATWSEPTEITATFERFRPDYAWRVMATGPGHGIALRKGRLLVPVWLSTATGGHGHRPSVVATIYSDDHGRTWQRGEIAVPNTSEFIYPNETAAVELADGRVMLNVRSESKANRRLITTSPDGAGAWSPPVFHDQLREPICAASMARLSLDPPSDRNRLLFSNPDTLDALPGQRAVPGKSRVRKDVTVKLSYDEGQTWPVTKRLENGLSGYSDLAVGPDGTIYCFYECASTDGNVYRSGNLTLAWFNLRWLTDGHDLLPETTE